jgi:hypothetical protein
MTEINRRAFLLSGAAVTTTLAMAPATTTYAADGRASVKRYVFTGRFTDPNGPDWVYLPFTVPKRTRKIHVSYEYNPSSAGGFSTNVVDIGIFDNDGTDLGNAAGFRGWSGGARRAFMLTRHRATPGYLAGPITPGTWRVALGPYQINGQGTPYRVVVECHLGQQFEPFEADPAPQEVAGTGPGWYRGDLHTHTVNSDGRWTQTALAAAAQAAGLDFIGSSEHNTSAATRTWGSYVPEGLLVINGEEVTTRSGHWLAMGLPAATWIDWRYRAADNKLDQFTAQVSELGGVSIAAHPYQPIPSIRWEYGYSYPQVDAQEVWNGPWTGDDELAVSNWDRLLKLGTFVPAVGNSDSHNDTQTVGLAQSVMRLGTLSAAEVVAAVKGGHLWIAESSAIDLTFTGTTGGQSAECGDHLTAAPGDTVTAALHVTGVPGCVGQLIGPGGVLAGALADSNGVIDLSADLTASSVPYVRAEVRRPDGAVASPVDRMTGEQMVALTNPVFTDSAA